MKNNGENSVYEAEKNGSGSLGALIKRTAVMTVLCFLVAVSLVASLIGCFFPKAYMDLYRSVGAYGIASVYAEEALDRASHDSDCSDTDCNYILLVTSGVDITSVAFDDNSNAAHAERLLKFTDAYLAASCHEKHSEAVDNYYAGVYSEKKQIATLVAVYGYNGYVRGRQTAALGALAENGKEYADRLAETCGGAVTAVTEPSSVESVLTSLDILTACAERFALVLEQYSDILYEAVSGYLSAIGAENVTFNAARLGYKIYRFASAMERAHGSAAFEENWNNSLVTRAYEEYNKLIKQYTTREV